MHDSDNDIKAIIEVIKLYFNGAYYGDEQQLSQAFHINAHVTGLIEGNLVDWPIKEFIHRLTQQPTAEMQGDKYAKTIISIDNTPSAAMVKTRVLVGKYLFTDYITLLKINGKWIIRNKSFTTD